VIICHKQIILYNIDTDVKCYVNKINIIDKGNCSLGEDFLEMKQE
jgi:hypothetical protein